MDHLTRPTLFLGCGDTSSFRTLTDPELIVFTDALDHQSHGAPEYRGTTLEQQQQQRGENSTDLRSCGRDDVVSARVGGFIQHPSVVGRVVVPRRTLGRGRSPHGQEDSQWEAQFVLQWRLISSQACVNRVWASTDVDSDDPSTSADEAVSSSCGTTAAVFSKEDGDGRSVELDR